MIASYISFHVIYMLQFFRLSSIKWTLPAARFRQNIILQNLMPVCQFSEKLLRQISH